MSGCVADQIFCLGNGMKMIPADAPLDFASFRTFVEIRSKHLFDILKELGKSRH